MQPHTPYPQHAAPAPPLSTQPQHVDTEPTHRGPLSRTWPQLFKKRRRYSPVRESVQPFTTTTATATVTAAPQQPRSSTSDAVSAPRTQPIPARTKIPISRRGSSISGTESNSTTTSATTTTSTSTTNAADLLASKSNYELISTGQHLEMGLHFSTAMATGVMMKRATHRAAEQARRDRMKGAMVELAEFLLGGEGDEVEFGGGTTCFVISRGGDERRAVNKARLVEMAIERMKAQEGVIDGLRSEVERLRVGVGAGEKMDVTE